MTREIKQRGRLSALPILLTAVAATAMIVPIAVNETAAVAAPVVSCNQMAKYSGLKSAKIRCDAVTTTKVRLRAQCWAFPYIPIGHKYGAWTRIPAGQWRYASFTSKGWCSKPGLIWSVTAEKI